MSGPQTSSGDKGVKVRIPIREWCAAGLLLALAAMPALSQNRRDERRSSPPPRSERRESRPAPRYESRPPRQQSRPPRQESRPQSSPEARPRAYESRPPYQPAPRDFRTYQPPAQGHHSGQWLNRHRDQSLDQQRQALQRDPNFRRLPPQRQQQLEQRLQRFNSMPQERQQQTLRRMEVWEHLNQNQKQDFRDLQSHFSSLPEDRKHAVRSAIERLRAMPPQARQREIESGRFSQFSPQERQVLNDAVRLPLAPAENNESQPEQQNPGSQRYVPRPPR